MKTDNMKKFIQENKEAFETERPSANLWDRIEEELPEVSEEKVVKMIPVTRVWRMMAGVAAVLVIGFLTWPVMGDSPEIAETENQGHFSNVNQLEMYYSVQVNEKMERLKVYNVDEDLLEEIALLKEEFEELKSEADKGLNQEDILDSMIDNYRLRVSILEDIMREVQAKTEKKEDNHVTQ